MKFVQIVSPACPLFAIGRYKDGHRGFVYYSLRVCLFALGKNGEVETLVLYDDGTIGDIVDMDGGLGVTDRDVPVSLPSNVIEDICKSLGWIGEGEQKT